MISLNLNLNLKVTNFCNYLIYLLEIPKSIEPITEAQSQLAKSLIKNTDPAVSLMQTSFNDSENVISSKIQILPPTPKDNLDNPLAIFNVSKEKALNQSNEFTT